MTFLKPSLSCMITNTVADFIIPALSTTSDSDSGRRENEHKRQYYYGVY